jgi:hypothetical protein
MEDEAGLILDPEVNTYVAKVTRAGTGLPPSNLRALRLLPQLTPSRGTEELIQGSRLGSASSEARAACTGSRAQ